MRGVIWTCDRFGDGIEKLQYIRDRYIWSGVNVVREVYSRSSAWVEFDNGDTWRVASASDCGRGIRSNYAWIDSRCSEEFVNCVIKRTLTCDDGPRHYEFFRPRSDN